MKKMRTEEVILADIAKAKEEYDKKIHKSPATETDKISDRMAQLKKELSSVLAIGAKACPSCKGPAIGMKKSDVLYEVGCPVCSPVTKDKIETSYSSRAGSPELAVKKWNEGKFVRKQNGVVMPD